MSFEIQKKIAANAPADPADVRVVKIALNRLGYYAPPKDLGITNIPDRAMFAGLKKFQKDNGLRADAEARPDDDTVRAIQRALKSQESGGGKYIWRTAQDSKVRPEHVARDGKIFVWNDPPEGGHPGADYNCRCWAEAAPTSAELGINDPPLEPVYPEILLLPFFRFGKASIELAATILKRFRKIKYKSKNDQLTDHGMLRSGERNINQEEIKIAIETAKKSGNVKIKIGKYGTPQIHYKGKNGVSVVVETTGRNAGKVITLYRH